MKTAMMFLVLILLSSKVVYADNDEEASIITITPDNVEIIEGEVEKGEKGQLVDGQYDQSFVVKRSGGACAIKLHMSQINCVHQIDTYVDVDNPTTVSYTWFCTSTECTCNGGALKDYCETVILSHVTITVDEGTLPDDLPPKSDCMYGDTAIFSFHQEATGLEIIEMTMTGYQLPEKSDTDESDDEETGDDAEENDCEKTWTCLSAAEKFAVIGISSVVTNLITLFF